MCISKWKESTDTAACPKCRSLIERREGCNHMVCRCKHEFCWLCGDVYRGGHFVGGVCRQFGGRGGTVRQAAVAMRLSRRTAASPFAQEFVRGRWSDPPL
jgi:hypothetical protein